MNEFQSQSGSDTDSTSLEGDAVILYGCKDTKLNPPEDRVTKVLIGPRDPNVTEIVIFPDNRVASSGGGCHELISPFGPTDQCEKPQTGEKSVKQLAEAYLAVQKAKEDHNLSSPLMSRRCHQVGRLEVVSTNPFLADTGNVRKNTEGTSEPPPDQMSFSKSNVLNTKVEPNGVNLGPQASTESTNCSNPTAIRELPLVSNDPQVSTVVSPEPSKAINEKVTMEAPSSSLPALTIAQDANNLTQTTASTAPPQSVLSGIPPDVILAPQELSCTADQDSGTTKTHCLLNGPGVARIQTLNAACTELSPIPESLNTPFQSSESSFHFPEPPQSAPLVCVPVKEVKFEEPYKHEVTSQNNMLELGEVVKTTVQPSPVKEVKFIEPVKEEVTIQNNGQEFGEIVPITVQPSHCVQSMHDIKDTENLSLPHTETLDIPKSIGESSALQIMSHNSKSPDVKLDNHRGGAEYAEAAVDHTQEDQHNENSYGIIGNDDNMSEITLPPLSDHENNPNSNGHPPNRIRISIDHQAATPSKRTTIITVLLVILLVAIVSLLTAYKFLRKGSPD